MIAPLSLRGPAWILFHVRLSHFRSSVLSRFKHLLLTLFLSFAPLQFPDNDRGQDLHYLWEETAVGRLQWLGKDSRRAGAHLPGLRQCPPAMGDVKGITSRLRRVRADARRLSRNTVPRDQRQLEFPSNDN
jgi:hypothetical protein